MEEFILNKLYEGAAASALNIDIKFCPDLDNPVLSGQYYKDKDGKIINANLIKDYDPKFGLPAAVFPRFMAFNVYESEEKFHAQLEQVRQRMIADGRAPIPLRNPIRSLKYLWGAEARAFLEEHQDSDINPFGFKLTGSARSFKDKNGRIVLAGLWLEQKELSEEFLENAGFKGTSGPWIHTTLIYESETSAREWATYNLDQVDRETREHLLYRYTNNKPNWPAELEEWQSFLAGELNIPIAQLDFSLQSCDLLEAQRNKLGISRERYQKDFFAPCLGYLYEVVRRHRRGTWEMRRAPHSATIFEPFIKLQNGRLLHFFVEYWDWVYEEYEEFSLNGTARFAAEFL